jgi:hypothetical protein
VAGRLINGGYLKLVVLTQYKSHSLDRHISKTWRLSTLLGNYVAPVPAQQRLGPRWFAGSADAIHQSMLVCKTATTEDTPHVDDQVGAVPGRRARSHAPARGDDRHGHHTAPVRTTRLLSWKGLTGAGRLDFRR